MSLSALLAMEVSNVGTAGNEVVVGVAAESEEGGGHDELVGAAGDGVVGCSQWDPATKR